MTKYYLIDNKYQDIYEYKYHKYKYKYQTLKYNLHGGNQKEKDDFIYDIVTVLNDKDIRKIEENFIKTITNIKNDANIKTLIKTISGSNKLFNDIKEIQILFLCLFCNSMNNINAIIEALSNVLINFINNKHDIKLIIKDVIPCSSEATNMLNKIYDQLKINYGNKIKDLPGIQIFLIVLNMFIFNIKNIKPSNEKVDDKFINDHKNIISDVKNMVTSIGIVFNEQSVAQTIKKYSQLLNISFIYAEAYILGIPTILVTGLFKGDLSEFTDILNKLNSSLLQNITHYGKEALIDATKAGQEALDKGVKEAAKVGQAVTKAGQEVLDKGLKDAAKAGQAVTKASQEALDKGVKEAAKVGQAVDKGIKDVTKATEQFTKGLLGFFGQQKGGGELIDSYLKIKNSNLNELISSALKLIIDKSKKTNIFDSTLFILKIFVKIINDNSPVQTEIFKSYLNIIDSLICFFLILHKEGNKISNEIIEILKNGIYIIFGPDLNDFSNIINNFIQTIYDTFIKQTCPKLNLK
jgi:hypothetical protein